jgi:hypothetical protein
MAYGKKNAAWDFDQAQKKLDSASGVKVAHRWSPERRRHKARREENLRRKLYT